MTFFPLRCSILTPNMAGFMQQNYFSVIFQLNIQNSLKENQMQEKLKQWTPQEIQLLKEMNNLEKHRKWKKVSLYFQQRGLNRSHVECRNKWVNFSLAPDINHRPWTEEELRLLFSLYETHESSWSSIQRQMPGRTQIKIKNHFYGVLRGIIRFVLKYFKEVPRKQIKISNKIAPKSLQLLYKGAEQFSFLGDIIPQTVAIMEYRFNKHKIAIAVEKNLQKFEKLNKQILQCTAEMCAQGEFDAESNSSVNANPLDQIKISGERQARSQIQTTELRLDPQNYSVPAYFYCNISQNKWESLTWHSYPSEIGLLPYYATEVPTNQILGCPPYLSSSIML